MGAATWIARQLAKTDGALLRVQAGMPLQVGSDPLCQGVLYGLGLKGLRIVAGYKAYPAFAWPVMGFGGYPAQLLAAYTNQMPGRMQAGMQPTAGFVDLSLCPACRYGHADVVHDSILSLHNLDDLAVADPARVAGLPAALGMKGVAQRMTANPSSWGAQWMTSTSQLTASSLKNRRWVMEVFLSGFRF